MEGADENSGISRDLMNKRIKTEAEAQDQQPKQAAAEQNEGKIELNLGLSMNGRFGVDPSSANKLKRSRSVSNLPGAQARGAARADHSQEVARGGHAPLPRASSLPAGAEERWGGFLRRGKELAAAAARKKRMEKMKSARVVKGDVVETGGSGLHEGGKGGADVKFPGNDGVANGSGNPMMVQSSEGSIGSQMGSAGFRVPQGPTVMGANHNNTMPRSSSSRQIPNVEHGVPRPAAAANGNRDERRRLLENAMLDMPHVSTRGEGVNRIKGVLYKYARADELKIVCACHGFFLSPAEFVKHGGGGDVAQPLRHIVVNSRPLFQV